jgi:predicted lipoprotein with Yx(FWY)xxD motif
LLWRRLGDADGKPLYTFDKDGIGGKPTCVGECAKEFPPYLAAKGTAASGA